MKVVVSFDSPAPLLTCGPLAETFWGENYPRLLEIKNK